MPSVVSYDKSGNVVAVGLEANADTNPDLLGVDGLVTRLNGFTKNGPLS